MVRKFYLLPAAYCAAAVKNFLAEKQKAIETKKQILSQYGAMALSRRGAIGEGLVFKEHVKLPDFLPAKKIDVGMTLFLLKPMASTVAGKEIKAQLNEAATCAENADWALEKAIGVHAAIFHENYFHHHYADALPDGRVILSMPVIKSKKNHTQNEQTVPKHAIEMTEAQYQELIKQSMRDD